MGVIGFLAFMARAARPGPGLVRTRGLAVIATLSSWLPRRPGGVAGAGWILRGHPRGLLHHRCPYPRDRMGRLGSACSAMPFGWAGICKTSQGAYVFSGIRPDRRRAPPATGCTAMPFIYGTPTWARNCSGIPAFDRDRVTPLRSPRRGAPAGLRSCESWWTATGRPKGTLWTDTSDAFAPPYLPIRTWQIWNEDNSSTYFRPNRSPRPTSSCSSRHPRRYAAATEAPR